MTKKISEFSAADAALGYAYQVRIALLWSLRRLKQGLNFVVTLETLDDVTFETKGQADELLQTKHHKSKAANLTDASPDLWKTLRVWFEAYAKGAVPKGAALHLLTTATASPGSAASYLRVQNRNVTAALQALESTAQSSGNKENLPAYTAFLSADAGTRRQILDSIVIFDAAEDVLDLNHSLRTEVYWATEPKYHETFLDRLEGWWLRRVVKHLGRDHEYEILSDEIEAQMSDLREQFKADALPIDEDLLDITLDATTYEALNDSIFVRQIELTKAGRRRIAAAIRDYYRAYEQRSRWIRDDLLLIGDLDKYENRLAEEWELYFEATRDELGSAAIESAKESAARDVLAWAERVTIPIRPMVVEPFVTRGSLHMLSDELRIGWHVEFYERLKNLLTSRTGS
jgi:hypothetical protein